MLVTFGHHSVSMELRHLRYFVAVAEELSFRKAADRLNVSRPALSKQVKDLENEIEVKLLDRDTVSVSLTKAGEIFLADSQRLLRMAEAAVERAAQAQSGLRGTLRIGSVGIIATDFLPKTLKVFRQKHPGMEVAFVEILPTEQLEALASGRIDIGFIYGREVLSSSGLNSMCVIESTFGMAVSRQHPLALREQVTLNEIRLETLLTLGGEGKSGHRDEVLRLFAEEGVTPAKVRKIDGFDSLATLIAADQGISLLPHVLDLKHQDIVIVPLAIEHADLNFRLWVAWQREMPSIHVKHFLQLLKERVQARGAA